MRVAICSDTFLPQVNGVTNTLDKLLKYLEKKGHQYKMFAPEDEKEYFYHNVERFKSIKFWLYPECRFSLPNYFQMHSTLRKFQPDIIHLVTPFNIGLGGLQYALKYHIPLVSSYHTNFTKYLYYYNLSFLESVIWKYFYWFHSFCSKNYCPSVNTMQELKKQGFKNLEIWDRGIDVSLFSPANRNEELREKLGISEKIVFIYVGRLAAEKNLDVLMRALRLLNSKYEEKICLLVVGDGPLAANMRKEAPANVIFTGYKKGKELCELYASADIFAFPSSTETYGNVVLEAMASGLPAVCAQAGGVLENCCDGENSLLFTPGDHDDLAAHLQALVVNEQLRNNLAAGARKHALAKGWEQVFARLLGSYNEVIVNHLQTKSA